MQLIFVWLLVPIVKAIPPSEHYKEISSELYSMNFQRNEDKCVAKYIDNVIYLISIRERVPSGTRLRIIQAFRDFADEILSEKSFAINWICYELRGLFDRMKNSDRFFDDYYDLSMGLFAFKIQRKVGYDVTLFGGLFIKPEIYVPFTRSSIRLGTSGIIEALSSLKFRAEITAQVISLTNQLAERLGEYEYLDVYPPALLFYRILMFGNWLENRISAALDIHSSDLRFMYLLLDRRSVWAHHLL